MWSDATVKSEAIEIVTFRLARGVSFADFVEANRDDEAAARAAMHRLMDELADSPVHALIDQATVTWTVVRIGHKHEIDD